MAGVTLSSAALAHMSALAGRPLLQKSVVVDEERARASLLRTASAERSAKWPNTLAALRQKKLDSRKARLAAEEAERVAMDEAEADLRTQERLAVIERANRLVLQGTAGMRAVRSQVLTSHVLDEREAQLALKAESRADAEAAEREYHEGVMRRVREADAAEAAAAAARRAKQRDVAIGQAEQLAASNLERLRRLDLQREEGAALAAAAAAAAAAAVAAHERKRAAAAEAAMAMQEVNERLKVVERVCVFCVLEPRRTSPPLVPCPPCLQAVKKEAAAEAAAALAATIAHADAKAIEVEQRAAFIEAKRAAARERAAHISDIVSRDFAARLSDQESRVATQVAEAQARADSIDERRRALQRDAQLAIAADRQSVLARRESEKAAAKEAAARSAAELRAKVEAMAADAAAVEAAARERTRQLAAFHLAQARPTMGGERVGGEPPVQLLTLASPPLQMADKKRVFEGAAAGVKQAAAASAAAAAGEVGDDFTATLARAAAGVKQTEAAKGRSPLAMERTLGRQQVVVAAERRRGES